MRKSGSQMANACLLASYHKQSRALLLYMPPTAASNLPEVNRKILDIALDL